VNLNGTSYSFGPNGMDIRSKESYYNINYFREGMQYQLSIGNNGVSKLEAYLSNYKSEYSYFSNNCTTPVQNGLDQIGFGFNRTTTPMGLENSLNSAGLLRKQTDIPAQKASSRLGAPWTWVK
jgi:hypothetical protein